MIKKITCIVLALVMMLTICIHASAAPMATEMESASTQENERKINLTKKISLSAGDTWKQSFNTDRFLLADHDAFRVKVTNVSGSFKVMILGGDGFFYESYSYTNSNATITVKKVDADTQYTVSVINISNNTTLTATVEIESFYME